MSYENLQIWSLARELTISIHKMTLALPGFEQYEEAQQIRRSIKSVRSNIVEGYGRRFYKQEFIRFIIFALASNDETTDHLDILFETGSLVDKELYIKTREKLDILGRKLNNFRSALERGHTKPDKDLHALEEDEIQYENFLDPEVINIISNTNSPESRIQNPESRI